MDEPTECGECGVSLLTAISVADREDYVEEPILLTDETLKLAECGQYNFINKLPSLFVSEARYAITRFSSPVILTIYLHRIFCKNNHLCSIDGNTIEADKDLFFSGTIRCSPDGEYQEYYFSN